MVKKTQTIVSTSQPVPVQEIKPEQLEKVKLVDAVKPTEPEKKKKKTGANYPPVSQKSLPSPISRLAGLPSPLLDLASRFCDRTPRCLQSFGRFPKIAMHVATSLLKQFRPCVMQFIEDLIACHC